MTEVFSPARDPRWHLVKGGIQHEYDIDENFHYVRIEIAVYYLGQKVWSAHELRPEDLEDLLGNQETFSFLMDKMVEMIDDKLEEMGFGRDD